MTCPHDVLDSRLQNGVELQRGPRRPFDSHLCCRHTLCGWHRICAHQPASLRTPRLTPWHKEVVRQCKKPIHTRSLVTKFVHFVLVQIRVRCLLSTSKVLGATHVSSTQDGSRQCICHVGWVASTTVFLSARLQTRLLSVGVCSADTTFFDARRTHLLKTPSLQSQTSVFQSVCASCWRLQPSAPFTFNVIHQTMMHRGRIHCCTVHRPYAAVVPLDVSEASLQKHTGINANLPCSKRKSLIRPMTSNRLLGEPQCRSSNAPRMSDSTTCSCASFHQMRRLHPQAMPTSAGSVEIEPPMRASAFGCSTVSPHQACHCSNCWLAHTRHHDGHP